ncbi:ABC transporter permease [Ignavigranum ruoffiae]|uniref:ABC transporter permease n=1 Tax=Ignavigranum ruoffiae TaxID=89093 RepID=UPI00205B4866|nr:ABC transporter permease [Ignavigranum ruoffiae]UPQ86222.1 ABC transporter permease [Ignavigranum ruoffiae]
MKKFLWKEVIQNKLLWVFIISVLLMPLILHVYNSQQEDLTYERMSQNLQVEQDTLNMHQEMIRYQKEIDPDFDANDRYDQLLLDANQTLMQWKNKLHQNNYFFAREALNLYQSYQSIENLPKFFPILGDRQDELLIQQERAEIMQAYNFPYLMEDYPTLSVNYLLQLADWMFGIYTAVAILLLFAFRMYRVQHPQFDFILISPIKRQQVIRFDQHLLMLAMAVVVFIYAIVSSLVLTMTGWKFLWYPIILSGRFSSLLMPVWQIILVKLAVWLGLLTGMTWLAQLFAGFIRTKDLNFIVLFLLLFILQNFAKGAVWNPLSYFFDLNNQLLSVQAWVIISQSLSVFVIWLIYSHSSLLTMTYQYLYRSRQRKEQLAKKIHCTFLPSWINFELTKRLRHSYVKRVLWILLVGLGVAYLFIYFKSTHAEEEFRDYLENQVSYYQDKVVEMTNTVELIYLQSHTMYNDEFKQRKNKEQSFKEWYQEQYPADFESIESIKSTFENSLSYYQIALDKLNQGNFDQTTLIQFRERYYLDEQENLKQGHGSAEKPLLAGQAQNILIKENNLKPLLLGNLLLDQYHPYYGNRAEQSQWDHSMVHSLYIFFENHLHLIGIVLLFIVLFASISEEVSPVPHLDFLFLQPRKRQNLYLSKLFYNIIAMFMLLVTGMLTFMGLAMIFGGLGQFNYPVAEFVPNVLGQSPNSPAIYASGSHLYFQMVEISQVVFRVLILLIPIVLFMLSFGLFLSIWLKHRFIVVSLIIVLCCVGYYLSRQFIAFDLISYFPFLYLNAFSIADGWLAQQANVPQLNALTGVGVLISWSILLSLAGWGSFRIRWERTRNHGNSIKKY